VNLEVALTPFLELSICQTLQQTFNGFWFSKIVPAVREKQVGVAFAGKP